MESTRVFRETLEAMIAGRRIVANVGGTRSGKTYSVLSLLIALAASKEEKEKNNVIAAWYAMILF